jgi:hypothetical protein
MSTTSHANVSMLIYLTDPLKTLTFALFWCPNTTRNHQDPLTQQQGGKFWTSNHAIQPRLGCFDLISSPRIGVEAILTKLCVAKSNWLYAVCSYMVFWTFFSTRRCEEKKTYKTFERNPRETNCTKRFFLSRFGPFVFNDEFKNTKRSFYKIKPQNLKNNTQVVRAGRKCGLT